MSSENRSPRRFRRPEEAPEDEVPREKLAPPLDHAQRVLALQRTAGNDAVGAELRRGRTATLSRTVKVKKSKLVEAPVVSKAILTEFPTLKAPALKAEATKWINDNKPRGDFTSDEEFYRAVAKPLAASAAPVDDDRWAVLGRAAKKSGKVTPVQWSKFNSVEQRELLKELTACVIQVSSNPDSSACHLNKHGKLPTAVAWKRLEKLSTAQKATQTPYFEILIPGHPDSGITRGVIDITTGRVYLTAHYDTGSFVLLEGAPATLSGDWTTKATAFVTTVTT